MLATPDSIRRILLVEDDQLVRETITLMLEGDFEVKSVGTAAEAVEHLERSDPPFIDVVLLDCLLPNGRTQDVLAEADKLQIPAVLISGDSEVGEKLDPNRLFLPKPFSLEALKSILHSARG